MIDYVKGCNTCLQSKPPKHQPYGQLIPLPIPDRPWASILMNSIELLPVLEGNNSILVVVDPLAKMTISIASMTNLTPEALAPLSIAPVFSRHGAPSDIVLNKGSKFTSAFWRALNAALNIEQKLSTVFHPQTNGQTGRVNQILEAYLCQYVDYKQSNWAVLLPVARFAYNNLPLTLTGTLPFFANKGSIRP